MRQALNYTYAWLVENRDQEERDKLDDILAGRIAPDPVAYVDKLRAEMEAEMRTPTEERDKPEPPPDAVLATIGEGSATPRGDLSQYRQVVDPNVAAFAERLASKAKPVVGP